MAEIYVQFCAVITAIALGSLSLSNAETSIIRILTILPYPADAFPKPPSWSGGINIVPAMNLSVEMINNRSDILSGYEMELVNENGGCEYATEALISFTSRILYQRSGQIAGLIGPGCSASTLAVLPLVNREEIALINIHGAGSHLVENRTLYPNSLGILGSTRSYADALSALIIHTGWTRIAILFEEARTYFLSIYQALLAISHSKTIGFTSIVSSTYYPLSEIASAGIRIIVVLAGSTLTQNIMCLAHHEGMLYPDYQWILVGRGVSEFDEYANFTYDREDHSCSFNLLTDTILTGNLLLNFQLNPLDNTTVTDSGLNYVEYLERYSKKVDEYNQKNNASATPSIWAPMYFDAIWALALAFNSSGIDVSSYHRGNVRDTDIIVTALYSLDFEGVSGSISFDKQTGLIDRHINIYQVFNGEQILTSYTVNGTLTQVTLLHHIPSEFRIPHTALSLTVFFTVVTFILTVLVIVSHIITIVYRKHASVKATSLNFNHIIYFGCYVWFAGAVLYNTYRAIDDKRHPLVVAKLCQAVWAWFLPIGYTLIFGTVSARTWRLYRIFTHYMNPGPLISNEVLLVFVMLLLTFDITLATVWTVVDPFQINDTTVVADSEEALKPGSTTGCNCKYILVWYLILYGYRVLLLMVAVLLSLLTHNIHNPNFTTKFLRIFVYLVSLVFALGMSVFYISVYVVSDANTSTGVMNVVLHMVGFLVLVVIFLPLVWSVVKGKVNQH